MKSRKPATAKTASRQIDKQFRDAGDWREETLARMRELILEADPEMIEERKWRKPSNAMQGVPVWSHNGIVCTGETYSKVVKLTFARAPASRTRRASSTPAWKATRDGRSTSPKAEKVDARAFKAIVKAAVALNGLSAKTR
jgi:hypothetical protein